MNNNRRKVLKGFVYGSVLTATSYPALALASQQRKGVNALAEGISILRENVLGKEQITLVNNTSKRVSLNAEQPISIEYACGLLLVKVNTVTNSELLVGAKESLQFEIDAYNVEQIFSSLPFDDSSNDAQLFGHLNIVSDHLAFNRTVPVTSLSISTAA